ncbi:MAG: hypothetical protein NTZ39_06250, partial [Methanoregula sp.]|nr:hypothetical protein [Methanoregula sp.]
MTAEVLNATRILFASGQVIEVRAITEDGVASGYFDSQEELAAKVDALDSLLNVQGIYVTVNPVNPALFSRRANRIKMRLGKKDATTADGDIVHRQWLPVDIDPVRPSGVSSTDAEHELSIAKARSVAEFLTGEGFPAPVLADSGNGAHLLYRIDLPNDEAGKVLVKRCLEVLAGIFDDNHATIDTANYNAARIWKLYGTVSRKGDHTPESPHRRSRIISVPDSVAVVTAEQLHKLAGHLPAEEQFQASAPVEIKGYKNVTNLSDWLNRHGIIVKFQKPYASGTLFILDQCPFSGDHKDGAFAIQFPSGGIHAGCHHQTCGGGSQKWQELRELFEPKAVIREAPLSRPPRGPGPGPVPCLEKLPGYADALTVLSHGDPKQAMLRTFALDHEGDETVAECLILSIASRSIINTKGLHVSETGESGKGKSHA